ncbi:YlxR family protein [Mumia zhuanghuii]|uniref:YlxR family protein n=2 Tax=Mumia TaxID=1546255 RepID=A0ABW1QSL0_9ACTN|nr:MULTISPECIES: YlxR family protein [Mumia]KAA1420759.1 YlxR family protein [Mumia zhuanghuii]
MRPVRTCIGCRARVDKSDLVRVVAIHGEAITVVTPDLLGSAPGRGAHLHLDLACLERAKQRKAFARALRVEGPLDTEQVDALVRESTSKTQPAPPTGGA